MLRRAGAGEKFLLAAAAVFFLLLVTITSLLGLLAGQKAPPYVAVLSYHHIHPTDHTLTTITPQLFEEQIKTLKEAGYTFISAEDLALILEGQKPVPDRAVLITIDDGFTSVHDYAMPILKRYKIPATVFVVVGFIGQRGEFGLPHMNWQQLQEVAANGITVYAHSYLGHEGIPVDAQGHKKPFYAAPQYLPREKRTETLEEYYLRAYKDLVLARTLLENKLQRPVQHFCWPYGAYNEVTLSAGEAAGFRYFYTTHVGLVTYRTSRLEIPRVSAGDPGLTGQQLLARLAAEERKTVRREFIWQVHRLLSSFKPGVLHGQSARS